jgi:hypothetical protein
LILDGEASADRPGAGVRSLGNQGKIFMTHLIIHCNGSSTNDCCALCGDETSAGGGPQLLQADSLDVVCRKCGQRHAPELVALLDLASTAARVGRLAKHTLVPPLTALLDLARAAENYTTSKAENGNDSGPSRRSRPTSRLCAAAR